MRFLSVAFAAFLFILPNSSQAASRGLFKTDADLWYQTEAGKRIQVQNNVERAYTELKNQAQLIATKDLIQIPIGLLNTHRPIKDTDRDGLDDEFERAYGTNVKLKDSDKDGYDDRAEIMAGYSPLKKAQSMILNRSLLEKIKGKFVWDAKWKELWFISPTLEKRFFISTQKTLRGIDLPELADRSSSAVSTPTPVPVPVSNQSVFRPITQELTVQAGYCGNRIQDENESCDGEWFCDARCGLSRLDRFEPNEAPLRSCFPSGEVDGLFQMSVGGACTYGVNGKTYTIRLRSMNERTRYPEYVVTGGGMTYETGFMNASHYPIENDFTLSRNWLSTDTVRGIFTVSVHKIIPTSQVVVRANCEALSGDERAQERCREFVQNQQTVVLPALDRMSGYSMGKCYREIQIRIDPSSSTQSLGSASHYGALGTISFQAKTLTSLLNLQPPLEEHEPLHLLNQCLNVPADDEYNHSFFQPKQSELYRLMGDTAKATEYATYVRENAAYDPAGASTPATFRGCAGVKTQLLSRRFIEDPGIVSRYYAALVQQVFELAKDGDADLITDAFVNKKVYNRIIARVLGSDRTVIDQINALCPDSRIED